TCLRTGPVAATLQTASDGGRDGPLLPDRALLPRRGPAGGSPTRIHPARPGDVLRRRGRCARRRRTMLRPRLEAGAWACRTDTDPPDHPRGRHAALRGGQARPSLWDGDPGAVADL